MKKAVLLAALAAAGCGAVYTSPAVHETGAGLALGAASDLDVRVVPLTHAAVVEANMSPYAPPRLPDAFRPRPGAQAPALGPVDARMPELPAPQAAGAAGAEAAGDDLPAVATQPAPPPGRPALRLPPAAPPEPYRIGVADVILLSADTSNATLDQVPGLIAAQTKRQGYIVQDDGAVAIPDVGRVRIAGLTLEEAEAAIFQALVEKRFDPSFSLEIAEFNSQRVSIGGAVREPRIAPITLKPLRLSEALQMAGGVNADGDYVVIRLFRDGEVYQIPFDRLYDRDGLNDVTLRDGDSVFVDLSYDVEQARAYFSEQLRRREAELREREFAFRQRQADIDEARFALTIAQFEAQKVQLRNQLAQLRLAAAQYEAARNADRRADEAAQRAAFRDRLELGAAPRGYAYLAGEARRPTRLPLPFEGRAHLADALFNGDGLSIQTADYGEIYVLRASSRPEEFGAVTAYHLNARNAANLVNAARFELRPNDIVFVAEQPITTWNRVLSQLTPTVFTQAAALATN
ncbi:polysaccharide biosynthesis/export family protein [Oceanicella actignis]|uniref:polysaccharide biosynthesis/export family protein n=1 Tax=Oceanicella actignis TaxID=1189325 RepID=UPI0012526F21|nr:polysaccharide biosynthesis/export family protein [Oceanicella actignis]TYO89114.1 polysaccharide export outer membrane protein [Oceanicella actignis]